MTHKPEASLVNCFCANHGQLSRPRAEIDHNAVKRAAGRSPPTQCASRTVPDPDHAHIVYLGSIGVKQTVFSVNAFSFGSFSTISRYFSATYFFTSSAALLLEGIGFVYRFS
jgi:hypothetical protein